MLPYDSICVFISFCSATHSSFVSQPCTRTDAFSQMAAPSKPVTPSRYFSSTPLAELPPMSVTQRTTTSATTRTAAPMAILDFFTCTFGFCTGVAEASCVPHAPQKAASSGSELPHLGQNIISSS